MITPQLVIVKMTMFLTEIFYYSLVAPVGNTLKKNLRNILLVWYVSSGLYLYFTRLIYSVGYKNGVYTPK
jgi:hypothetical protein